MSWETASSIFSIPGCRVGKQLKTEEVPPPENKFIASPTRCINRCSRQQNTPEGYGPLGRRRVLTQLARMFI